MKHEPKPTKLLLFKSGAGLSTWHTRVFLADGTELPSVLSFSPGRLLGSVQIELANVDVEWVAKKPRRRTAP